MGPCHSGLVHFCLQSQLCILSPMELEKLVVNDKITALCQVSYPLLINVR